MLAHPPAPPALVNDTLDGSLPAAAAGGRVRTAPARLAIPCGAALLGYAAVARGGFYWPAAGIFGVGLLICGILAVGSLRGLGTPIAAVTILALGLVPSAWANEWPTAARLPAAAIAAGAGALLLASGATRRGWRDDLLMAVEWIGAAVAAAGVVGLALHLQPLATRATGLWRAGSTLTYANAAGALLVLALPAALLRWRDVRAPGAGLLGMGRGGSWRLEVGHALAAFVIVTGVLASVSRGALLVQALWAVLAVILGAGGLLRLLVRPAMGAVVAGAGLAPSLVGRPGPLLVAVAAIAAGAAVAAVPVRVVAAPRVWVTVVALAIGLVAVGGAASALHGGRFTSSRLEGGAGSRVETWGQALAAFRTSPLVGTGPGSLNLVFHVRGPRGGSRTTATPFAHDEYLQVLAETGVVGLLSVLAAMTLLVWWAVRRRPERSSKERTGWAAAIGACVAFAVHAGIDVTWHFPVVVAAGCMWLGLAAAWPGGGPRHAGIRWEEEMA